MRRGIRRESLAFDKAEYRACVEADARWRPVAESMHQALSLLHRLRLDSPASSYLEVIERDLGRATDRFDAFRSTYDRRLELLRLAFTTEYPDAPMDFHPLGFSPEWQTNYAHKWRSFRDAWEAENGPVHGDKTVKERSAETD